MPWQVCLGCVAHLARDSALVQECHSLDCALYFERAKLARAAAVLATIPAPLPVHTATRRAAGGLAGAAAAARWRAAAVAAEAAETASAEEGQAMSAAAARGGSMEW